jgi:AcrR family transcriptional regulator
MTERLTRKDWIDHGLRTLAREGFGGLSVGPMAKALSVSRGSFYWHFRDIADFRAELLQGWRERSTERVIRDLDAGAGQPGALQRLLRQAFSSDRSLEVAIRNWATNDDSAAVVVASIDRRRIERIAELLTGAGVEPRLAQHRAAFLYWAYLGQAAVLDDKRATIPAAALDDICGLFES